MEYFHNADKVGKNAYALVAQPAVAFGKAFFRLTTAIAIEAQRLCLCTPRGNNFLDLFPHADKVGKNAYALVCATYGCLLEGFVPSYDGDCHRGAKTLSLQSARK